MTTKGFINAYHCVTDTGILYNVSEEYVEQFIKEGWVHLKTSLLSEKYCPKVIAHHKKHTENLVVGKLDWVFGSMAEHGLFKTYEEYGEYINGHSKK